MSATRTMKAFTCYLRGFDDGTVVHAQTAGKARYSFLLSIGDPYPSATFKDIKVHRSRALDVRFPPLPPVASQLNSEDRDAIVHAYGGGRNIPPARWGYRDHYCVDPGDMRLLKLVGLGLFRGPCQAEGWSGAFFYLTDTGKTVALALIGERECWREAE